MSYVSDLKNSSPSEWGVLSNNGSVLTAKNNSTGKIFSGTPAEFRALFTLPAVKPSEIPLFTGFTGAELDVLANSGGLTKHGVYITSDGELRYTATDEYTLVYDPPGGVTGIPVMWGPFTNDSVVKGVAGDPGIVLAIFCSASSSGNVTLRNSASSGGGTVVSPLVNAVTMTAGQFITCGPVDCPNGIFLDLNSGTGTFYVIGSA